MGIYWRKDEKSAETEKYLDVECHAVYKQETGRPLNGLIRDF